MFISNGITHILLNTNDFIFLLKTLLVICLLEVLRTRITLMRIRILLVTLKADADPDPSFRIKAQNLEKVLE